MKFDRKKSERQARERKAVLDALTPAENAETLAGHLQTIPAYLLAAVIRHEVDIRTLISAELSNRGLNEAADWVGFDIAGTQHKMRASVYAGTYRG